MKYNLKQEINNNISPIEQIFQNRNINKEVLENFLNPTEECLLPMTYFGDQLDVAVLMFTRHIRNNSHIHIPVDSDCDGITSSAILINYINKAFPDITITYDMPKGKEHGIRVDMIPEDTNFLIVPDSSSNEADIHSTLIQKGIDVLIIDHHISDTPTEACILNNQMCYYPNKDLSGAGMSWKFIKELDKAYNTNYANDYMDLAALGIVADVMQLNQLENRYIIHNGLFNIHNPFLTGMVDKQAFVLKNGKLNAMKCAFYIAPIINATFRSGGEEEKELMFKAFLEKEAYSEIPSKKRGCKGQMDTVLNEAIRMCGNCRAKQNREVDNLLPIIKEQVERENLLENKILLIESKRAIPPNIIGLIANKLGDFYQRPTILCNSKGDEVVGSLRSFAFSGLKEFIEESQLATFCAGHSDAAGTGFKKTNVPLFLNYANEKLKDYEFINQYIVDFIYSQDSIDLKTIILQIAKYEDLWGRGIEEPLLAIEKIQINEQTCQLLSPDKSPTLKITLPCGVCLMKFRSSLDEYEKLVNPYAPTIINVVGTANKNEYYGRVTPQLFIKDYEIIS